MQMKLNSGNIKFKGIDAIVIYGSSSRGDNDCLSDKDLLLISDDELTSDSNKILFEGFGYSCSCYTWRKIAYLSKKKALFIQHLKQESCIIYDANNRLQELLNNYSPAINYSEDIKDTCALVALTEKFPNEPYSIGWALDILAVGFRNFAILTFANEGQYIFSYKKILDEFKNRQLISPAEEYYLLSLRKYKSLFRNKQYSLLPAKDIVFVLQNIIGRLLDIDISSSLISEESFLFRNLLSHEAINPTSWYARLRLCEGAFLTMKHHNHFRDKDTEQQLNEIEKAISNPGCYHILLSNNANRLRLELLDILTNAKLKVA